MRGHFLSALVRTLLAFCAIFLSTRHALVFFLVCASGGDRNAVAWRHATGWGFEFAQPLGYMDCMWNGNYFVPWVDGSGSSSMMHALCGEFGVSAETGMIGRGSHGRALGENLLAFLKEENVWGEEE